MIYDVSMPINKDIQVYKNAENKKPVIEASYDYAKSDVYESTLTMNLHTGTHLDYPLHMVKNGKTSNNENLEKLITKAKVFDVSNESDHIGLSTVKRLDIEKGDFVLFKTKNSFVETFIDEFIYVDMEAAQYLEKLQVKGVGIDGLGIERAQTGHPTHKVLLENDIIIIEGLRLKKIKEGTYDMICLPLKITGVEANPARVVLLD